MAASAKTRRNQDARVEDLEGTVDEGSVMRHTVPIRNRASDRVWQKAKPLATVTSASQYGSTDYGKRNLRFQWVYVPENVYDDLVIYVEESRSASKFRNDPRSAESVAGGEN